MKTENKYEHGKIYKIVDNTNDNIYIGSTCKKSINQRLSEHKQDYTKYLNNKKSFVTSFDIIKNDNYDIILLENVFNCKSKTDLLKRERYYIENNKCINKVIPLRTKKEYRQDNELQIKKKRKQKAYCKICKIEYRKDDKDRHIRTLKHQKVMKKQDPKYKPILNLLKCNVCDIMIVSRNFNEHCKRQKHINNIQSQKHKDYIFKEALKDCLLSNMTLKQTREKLKHLI